MSLEAVVKVEDVIRKFGFSFLLFYYYYGIEMTDIESFIDQLANLSMEITSLLITA